MQSTVLKLSASGKQWNMPAAIEINDALAATVGGSKLLAAILLRRGFELDGIESFLDPNRYVPTHPDQLESMPDAVSRIFKAVEAQEQITVYGDYDVDGITGTSLLLTVLNLLGAKVDFYIPNRAEEGYGLNLKAVSVLASKRQTRLIITCDCGISNFAEINFAKVHGIDTIIVDHHTMPELLPPAVAILHPKFLPDNHALFHLPGVGVAYKLGEALLQHAGLAQHALELLDFVTLGMIADMVPLVKENRYLVQVGLSQLSASKRPGIQALLSNIGEGNSSGSNTNGSKSGNSDFVGFGLAPRINAVGRLADANIAVQLLTTSEPEIAQKLAQQLEMDNKRRQELCQRILDEAQRIVEAEHAAAGVSTQLTSIVIYNPDWHHGVVGIVASRLMEKYHCPVFVGELDPQKGELKGSARGIDGIDLHEVLKTNSNLLNRWGGHKMAAGFSLDAEKAPAFKIAIEETCKRMLAGTTLTPTLEVDTLLAPEDVGPQLVEQLSVLAPFGVGNRKPVLVMQNLKCSSALPLGKEQKHARLFLQDQLSKHGFEAVYWNHRGKAPRPGTDLDLAFCAEMNNFRGQSRLQLVVTDWRHTSDAPAATAIPSEAAPSISVTTDTTAAANTAAAATSAAAPLWKDFRNQPDPDSVFRSATKHNEMEIFGENVKVKTELLTDQNILDRGSVKPVDRLLLWSYPPSLQVFAQVINTCKPRHIYICGAGQPAHDTSNAQVFLKHLGALIRFAVNQRGGIAEFSRFSIALGTTDICIALGLALLKKMQAIDWFSDDGMLHFNLIGNPALPADTMPEYQQLTDALQEVIRFRSWCATANLNEISQAITQFAPALSDTRYNDALSGNFSYDFSAARPEASELA
jgi:single-stranded-DNA-specific exonuclease